MADDIRSLILTAPPNYQLSNDHHLYILASNDPSSESLFIYNTALID